jgi:hypothetical protein
LREKAVLTGVNALLAEKGHEAMTVDEVADVLKRSGNYRGAQVIELMHAAAFGGFAARVAPALSDKGGVGNGGLAGEGGGLARAPGIAGSAGSQPANQRSMRAVAASRHARSMTARISPSVVPPR